MTWAKLDDQFFLHPKIIDRSKDAKLLFLAGLTYCAGQLTDGLISPASLRMVAAQVDVPRETVDELLAAGLWEMIEGGYQVHDYLEYNPTGDEVRAKREARAEAGRMGGIRSGETRSQKAQANREAIEAKREANASHLAEANGEANAKQNRTPSPSPSPYPVLGDTDNSRESGDPTFVADADASSDEQSAHTREAAATQTTTSRKRRVSEPLPQDSEAVRLATLLRDRIRSHTPDARVPDTPAQLQSWAHAVESMLRLDRRAPPDIEAVIDFAMRDMFWRANILSPGKLREKYDQLNIRRQTQAQTTGGNGNDGMGRAAAAQGAPTYRANAVRGRTGSVQGDAGGWTRAEADEFNEQARTIRQQLAASRARASGGSD